MVSLRIHADSVCWDTIKKIESKSQMFDLVKRHCNDLRGRMSKHELCSLLEEISYNSAMPAMQLAEFCHVVGLSGMPNYVQPVCELLWAFRAMTSILRRIFCKIKEMQQCAFDAGLEAAVQILLSRVSTARINGEVYVEEHEADSTLKSQKIMSPHLVKMALEALCLKVSKTEALALFDALASSGVDGRACVDVSHLSDRVIGMMRPPRSQPVMQALQISPPDSRTAGRSQTGGRQKKGRRKPQGRTAAEMMNIMREQMDEPFVLSPTRERSRSRPRSASRGRHGARSASPTFESDLTLEYTDRGSARRSRSPSKQGARSTSPNVTHYSAYLSASRSRSRQQSESPSFSINDLA